MGQQMQRHTAVGQHVQRRVFQLDNMCSAISCSRTTYTTPSCSCTTCAVQYLSVGQPVLHHFAVEQHMHCHLAVGQHVQRHIFHLDNLCCVILQYNNMCCAILQLGNMCSTILHFIMITVSWSLPNAHLNLVKILIWEESLQRENNSGKNRHNIPPHAQTILFVLLNCYNL